MKKCTTCKQTTSQQKPDVFKPNSQLTAEQIKKVNKITIEDDELFEIFNSVSKIGTIDICDCTGIRENIISNLKTLINKSK